jgi:hypothetical protein
MAQYRRNATGNWSTVSEWSTWNGSTWVTASVVPGAADDVFANNFTTTIDQDIMVLTLRNTNTGALGTGTNNGGVYLISTGGYTISCTGVGTNILIGAVSIINVTAASGVTTINGNIVGSTTANINAITKSGAGTLSFIGNVSLSATNSGNATINISDGTLNVVGNIISNLGAAQSGVIRVTGNCTVNITGDLVSGAGTNCHAIWVSSGISTITVTGNATSGHIQILVNLASQTTFTLTGIVSYSAASSGAIISSSNANSAIYINGNILGNLSGGTGININCTAPNYVKIVGSITAGVTVTSVSNIAAASAITIWGGGKLTSSSYGILPIAATRLFIINSSTVEYEFASDQYNGATTPPIPARYSLYSANTLADAPIAADVREGTVYALGSQTGTLIVPSPANVALNVPTDNTVGTAVITKEAVKEAVWDALLNDITEPNSIGVRLKNAATVESTGAQLANLINT